MANDINGNSRSDASRQSSGRQQRPQQGYSQGRSAQNNQGQMYSQVQRPQQGQQQARPQQGQQQARPQQGQRSQQNSQSQQFQRSQQGQQQARPQQGQRPQQMAARGQYPQQGQRPQQAAIQDYDVSRYRQSGQEPEPKKKSKGKVVLIIAIVLVALLAVGFGAKALFGNSNKALQGTMVSVTIPEGSTADDFATILKEDGVISSKFKFIRKVKSEKVGTSLKPGTYTLTVGMNLDELIATLVQGPIVQPEGNKVTIPEGLKATEVAAKVEKATGISADDFMERVNSASDYAAEYPFLQDVFNNSLEGFLYPKTYIIPEDEDADYVIRLMLDQFEEETANLDLSYPESKGLSFYQVIIMASVVEKEVGPGEYAARAASVFYNRLDIGMQLQSDITMLYSVDWDDSRFDRYLDTPWNTYVVEGLPYGPICSPCIDTIEAVCHPEETNYLFFYSVIDTGETLFSETQEEHNAIVDKYEFGV